VKTIEILQKEGKFIKGEDQKKNPVVYIDGVEKFQGDKIEVEDTVAADLVFRKLAKYSEQKKEK